MLDLPLIWYLYLASANAITLTDEPPTRRGDNTAHPKISTDTTYKRRDPLRDIRWLQSKQSEAKANRYYINNQTQKKRHYDSPLRGRLPRASVSWRDVEEQGHVYPSLLPKKKKNTSNTPAKQRGKRTDTLFQGLTAPPHVRPRTMHIEKPRHRIQLTQSSTLEDLWVWRAQLRLTMVRTVQVRAEMVLSAR